MSLAPIVLFTYNRPDHTSRTLEALKRNHLAPDSDLIIFSDFGKDQASQRNVEGVRELIGKITGFKSVKLINRDRNWGLAPSIIDGVTQVVNQYGKVIVLEDDMLTNPYFLNFLNDGLSKYESDPRVIGIHGFIYPIENLPETFFIRGSDCWGWGTWKRGWDLFNPDGRALLAQLRSRNLGNQLDYDGSAPYMEMLQQQINGKISSWAVRWHASAFLNDKLTLYPGRSLLKNIGFDSGTHCYGGSDEPIFGQLHSGKIELNDIPVQHDPESFRKMADFFRGQKQPLPTRIYRKLRRILSQFTQC